MPRLSRAVFAGVPHHVTRRGNRLEAVFFSEEDCTVYLEWPKTYCEKYGVEILAYCLMTNHIHLIAVPDQGDGLQALCDLLRGLTNQLLYLLSYASVDVVGAWYGRPV